MTASFLLSSSRRLGNAGGTGESCEIVVLGGELVMLWNRGVYVFSTLAGVSGTCLFHVLFMASMVGFLQGSLRGKGRGDSRGA